MRELSDKGNKAILSMTAGFEEEDRKTLNREIRWSLENEEIRYFDELITSLCQQQPERSEKIVESAGYLHRFVEGISLCIKP